MSVSYQQATFALQNNAIEKFARADAGVRALHRR
jgi:hypothetical protein